MSLSNNYPTIRPTLEFDFANVGALDPRITFTRATSATFVNQLGVIQTAASGIPRFDYDPSTLAARGLLIEEQRTNLLTYSEQFDNAVWAQSYLTENITANSATSPSGQVTADTISDSSGNSEFAVGQTASATANVPNTFSVFAKANGSNFLYLRYYGNVEQYYYTVIFDLSLGTATKSQIGSSASNGSNTITSVGNGWYRLTVTATVNSGTLVPMVGIAASGTDTIGSFGQINVNGTGSRSCYIWGAQLEAGSFATSYIPTVASTVTRNADVASVDTLTPWYNATEGAFLFDFNQVGTSAIAAIGDDTFNNSLRFNIAQMARGVGSGFANVVLLGTSQNGSRKLAVAMKVNDYAGSFDGGAVSTQTTASMTPSPTVLGVGRDYGTNGYMNGWMRRLAYYPARLTNAQLQALTS